MSRSFSPFPFSRRLVAVPSFWLVLVVGLGAAASVATADSHAAEPNIKYRQKLMSAIGANMGAIGDILKNGLELPGHVENHAGQMAESAKLIAAAFEKPISEGATDAKPEIWEDRARFEQAIADFEKAARALQTAAAGGDPKAVGPAVKALGDRCGDCHKPFRKPKEESYKNR
jgi:cytochrome c556